tara:strand:- start:329 stop:1552 length:1224 start_codon:yes stop_codon:yes gene_type:complete
MVKLNKNIFTSYRGQLLDLARLYGVIEIKNYARSRKRLTTAQLELLLIKNNIKLPVNRSSARIIEQHEIREKSITNIYLSLFVIFFIGCMIATRPYIKNVVNEVRFTNIAQKYTESEKKPEKKKIKKEKKISKKVEKKETNTELLNDNTVSLNAQTTINLFEDLNYNLKGIRKGQQVKPIYLTKLPKDLKKLGNTSQKKEVFIKIVLPLILAENDKIKKDRDRLFKIINKNFNTMGEKVWLKRKFNEYKVDNSDLSELKTRMDIIPVSLAIAQAAKESGWGTSRFALEGNALFGQWTWSKKGISPANQDADKNHKILQFQILKASVRAYKNNLNTHKGYKEFRNARAQLREDGEKVRGLDLTKYLKNYAATGEQYIKIIELIIEQNSLTDFDEASLLPTRSGSNVAL